MLLQRLDNLQLVFWRSAVEHACSSDSLNQLSVIHMVQVGATDYMSANAVTSKDAYMPCNTDGSRFRVTRYHNHSNTT